MYKQYLEVKEASTDMKEDMNTWNLPGVGVMTYAANVSVCTDCPPPAVKCMVPAQKKEKNMYIDNDKHIESSKINYLSSRIEGIYFKKNEALHKQFGLVNDEPPETAVEMVKRIQDGKFVIKDEHKEKRTYGDAARYITWRDPAVKEDKDGYKAAMKLFDVAHQDARDAVAILSPDAGLVAVKDLEAWTVPAGK
jgi:hypothetical protein